MAERRLPPQTPAAGLLRSPRGLPAGRAAGFTLVEVLVATVVLAIGLVGALTAFSMAARVTGACTNDTTVSFLAQQKLAEIQARGSEQAGGQVQDLSPLTPGITTGNFAPAYPNYRWRMVVYRPDTIHLVQVDLTIYAPEAGKTRELRFNSAVF